MKLAITLGHNSSAVLIGDNNVLVGYEEERLSHIKSDSSFPKLAISQILKYYPEARFIVTEIYVSHWFWEYSLKEDKYYDPKFLAVNFPKAVVKTLSAEYTHHDAHADSIWNFSGSMSGLTIVADGFGNKGEVLSLYNDGYLYHRSYAIEWSLGLMYQYATAYLGMKENQDEYKLLGYEQECTNKDKTDMIQLVNTTAALAYEGLRAKNFSVGSDMLTELTKVRAKWFTIFDLLTGGERNKPVVARFVQKVLEKVILSFVGDNPIVQVSGGVFYNVKLNNAIVRLPTITSFEANPLCGDQGCAIGMAGAQYKNLFWGKRDIISMVESFDDYDNVFIGDMEFGPRALGNTTTLATPTLEVVDKINKINGRNTIMPMAPVVSKKFAQENFRDYSKLGRCKHFMIVSLDFKTMKPEWRGAAHIDTDRNVYTGRLQVIDKYTNEFVRYRVKNSGILINTSLNAHGQPILYDNQDYKFMEYLQG